MGNESFAGKFLRKLKKIDSEQIESFLAQVLREKTFLEVIFNSMTEGVIVVEQGQKVVFLNDAAKGLLGLGREKSLGKPLGKLLRVKILLDVAEEFEQKKEPIRQREVTLRAPERRVYSLTVVPIENESGVRSHAVWIIANRTEIHRAAEERQQVGNIESMATLTAGVAHEIKNPLNSLNIHAQLTARAAQDLRTRLPDEPALERLEHSTQVIREEIERLRRVVDQFITSVRPVHPLLRKAQVNGVIAHVAELVGPDCAARGIDLILSMDSELPPLLIDPEQIQQAILNLVKNAMEAINQSEGIIRLSTALKSDHAMIQVEDNGCGIPQKDRMKIFEPYHTTKTSGTGLGLMVVFRIVRAHQGAIGLSSEVGVGSRFSVALPLDERPVRRLESEVNPPIEVKTPEILG